MDIQITRDSEVPIYRQISNQIIFKIKNGNMQNKEKLMPERELALVLSVSRGTIKKAYENIINLGYARSEQGSGTFVKIAKKNPDENNIATLKIDSILDNLTKMDFNYTEIVSLIKTRLNNKRNMNKHLKIAVVDCNYETLFTIKNQLKSFENLNIMSFILGDVLEFTRPDEIFREFDYIVTTSKHFEHLKDILPKIQNKIFKVSMCIDEETRVKISNIHNPENIFIISKTKKFSELINNDLKKSGFFTREENYTLFSNLTIEKLNKFLENKKILIIPPLFLIELDKDIATKIFEFNKRGGEIIIFNYTIQDNSVKYLKNIFSNLDYQMAFDFLK